MIVIAIPVSVTVHVGKSIVVVDDNVTIVRVGVYVVAAALLIDVTPIGCYFIAVVIIPPLGAIINIIGITDTLFNSVAGAVSVGTVDINVVLVETATIVTVIIPLAFIIDGIVVLFRL